VRSTHHSVPHYAAVDPISVFFLMSKIPVCSHCLTVPDFVYSLHRQPTLIVKYVAQIVKGEEDVRRYRQSL